jgi:hypothetical protein
LKKIAIGLLLLAALALLLLVDPAESVWMPKCPFKLLTGLQCPGCGGQRAVHALLHGDVVGALRYNWFLIYAAPYLLLLIVERFFLRGDWQQKVQCFAENRHVVMFYVVSYCVWLVARNILHI